MKASISSGVLIPKKLLDVEAVVREVTAKYYAMGSKTPLCVEGFVDYGDSLLLPRQYGLHLIAKLGIRADNRMSSGVPRRFPRVVTHTGQYEYQDSFVREILGRTRHTSDFMVHAATGKGKTVVSLSVIQKLGRSAIVLVDQTNLMHQWVHECKKILGLNDRQIGIVQGTTADYVGKHVTIAMIQTLVSRSYPDEFYDYFGTVVVDECYHPRTEVLVEGRGWIPISSVVQHDKVAQYDAYSEGISFTEPSRIIERGFTGELVHLKGSRFNILVTPAHEQPYVSQTRGAESMRTVCRAQVHNMPLHTNILLPVAGRAVGFGSLSDYERVLVMLQADGHLLYTPRGCITGTRSVRFMFTKLRKINRCRELLDLIGCEYTESVNGREGTSFVARLPALAGKDMRDWVKYDAGYDYYVELTHEILFWDGHILPTGGGEYDTADITQVGVVQMVATLAGYSSRCITYPPHSEKHRPRHRVYIDIHKGSYASSRMEHRTTEVYDGMVFCMTVPKGNLVTRLDGVVSISGNCHTAGAPTFSQALLMFSAETRFGVSATVDRRDALQKLLHWNLGDVEASLLDQHEKSYVYYVESYTVYTWYANISPKVGRILSEVSNDGDRNNTIVRIIEWLYGEAGRDILVVSDRIEQLENLLAMCAYAGIPEEDMGVYSGFHNVWKFVSDPTPKRKPIGYEKGTDFCPVVLSQFRRRTPKKDLDNIKNTKRILFATFGMFTKGVDVPRLSAGVDCTPRSRAQQVHGRILRVEEGKAIPIWVTMRDVNSYRLERQFALRIDEYLASSAEVCEWNIDKGVRSRDAEELKAEAMSRCRKLQKMNIVTDSNGLSTLQTPNSRRV